MLTLLLHRDLPGLETCSPTSLLTSRDVGSGSAACGCQRQRARGRLSWPHPEACPAPQLTSQIKLGRYDSYGNQVAALGSLPHRSMDPSKVRTVFEHGHDGFIIEPRLTCIDPGH